MEQLHGHNMFGIKNDIDCEYHISDLQLLSHEECEMLPTHPCKNQSNHHFLVVLPGRFERGLIECSCVGR